MATVHVAQIRFVAVDVATKQVIDPCDCSQPLSLLQNTVHEHRIVPDPDLPNTAAQPDLKTYLETEVDGGFKLAYLGQSYVVTSDSVGSGTSVRVAYLGMVPVDAVGNVLDKNTASIGAMCTASNQLRVLPAAAAPSSAASPTVAQYLALEAAAGYVLRHMDQSMIVTYG